MGRGRWTLGSAATGASIQWIAHTRAVNVKVNLRALRFSADDAFWEDVVERVRSTALIKWDHGGWPRGAGRLADWFYHGTFSPL